MTRRVPLLLGWLLPFAFAFYLSADEAPTAEPVAPLPELAAADARLADRLAPHVGIWDGTYIYWSPSGEVLDRHGSRHTVELDGVRWTQRIDYVWEDGRRVSNSFDARIENGALEFDHDDLFGALHVVDERTLVFEAKWRSMPDLRVVETVTLHHPDRQTRTWQYLRGDRLEKVVLIEETRSTGLTD